MDLDKYHCPTCESISGPSIPKVKLNWHRHEYTEANAETKPVQTGTPVFVSELKSRHFPKADEVVKHIRGQQLTLPYLQTNGFDTPIIIDGKDGLDMTLPPSNFSVYDIESYIGTETIFFFLYIWKYYSIYVVNDKCDDDCWIFQVVIEKWM